MRGMWSALALAVTLGLGCVARAESTPSDRGTVLRLSASASISTVPDQLVAEMLAQSTSPTGIDAQRRVNALMAKGMQSAKAVPAVDARALGYGVSPGDSDHPSWTAQQTLRLQSNDGPQMLDLVGKLQAMGFQTASLDWEVSPTARRMQMDKATVAALRNLQQQATTAATALGMQVDHIQTVTIEPADLGGPRPMMAMMSVARAAGPPPQVTAAPEDVTARVSAEVLLKP